MDTATDTTLLESVLAAARKLGIVIEVLEPDPGDRGADVIVRIGNAGHDRTYVAEIKRGLRPATVGAALHQMERLDQPALLIADYVTPPMAETLMARGIAFLDAAGNAYLNQPPLLIWVKGERPTMKFPGGPPTGRAFRPGGLKVLFALLCHPEWVARPYRDLAGQAGVAHGTVGWVMADLQKLGFVAEISGERRLLQQARLLKQWTEAYARTLRPKLVLGRYRTDRTGWWEELAPHRYDVQLGGEVAAARITGYLRPGTVTLYGKKAEPPLLLDYQLRPDPAGPVEFVKRFWAFETNDEAVVPLPLIYADLLMIGDARCLETADLIHEKLLDGLVR